MTKMRTAVVQSASVVFDRAVRPRGRGAAMIWDGVRGWVIRRPR